MRLLLINTSIGDIDTLNEKFHADIYFEARWTERRKNLNTLNLTTQQKAQLLYENTIVKINDLNPTVHWSPKLFIENAIGQIGAQEIWFSIKNLEPKSVELTLPIFIDIEICEHRRVKGVFWEKLILNHVGYRFYAEIFK